MSEHVDPRSNSAADATGEAQLNPDAAVAAQLHAFADSTAASWVSDHAGDHGTATAATPAQSTVDAILQARERATDLAVGAVPHAVGVTLSMFAAMTAARAAVEVGTGAGVSGQWLLRGMRQDGVLTTIDTEPEHQRAARKAFATAGFAPARSRLICGRASEVLPRLADAAYDVVFIDAGGTENAAYIDQAVRLLRPGGVVAVHGILDAGMPWNADRHDPATVDARETIRLLTQDTRLLPAVVPTSGGLICASRV